MKLKELRKLTNKTQEQVAKELNMQKQTYQNYELGKREPDINTLKNLAKYYRTSIDYLCDFDENNQINLAYLTNNQKELILLTKQLNEINTIKAISYISGLIAGQ